MYSDYDTMIDTEADSEEDEDEDEDVPAKRVKPNGDGWAKIGPGVKHRKAFKDLTSNHAKADRLKSAREHLHVVAAECGFDDVLDLINTIGFL